MASLSHHAALPVGLSPTACQLAADLSALGSGDTAALRRIHAVARRPLWRTIERIVATPAIAEEILQDVFVKIWLTADRFDPAKASAWAWMTAIARHAAIDRLRQHQRRVATVSLDSLLGDEPPADDSPSCALHSASLASTWDGPAAALLARQLRREIRQLPAAQKQCLALAYDLGLSHAEVAEHLALPLGTVKCWLRRAQLSLRRRLDPPVH